MTSAADLNLGAEARAIEEGHRCRPQADGTALIVSDTHRGKSYRVTATTSAAVRFTCRPEGDQPYQDDHLFLESPQPGMVPCKHAALYARHLERQGLIRWAHGLWKPAQDYVSNQPDDPFEGLPGAI